MNGVSWTERLRPTGILTVLGSLSLVGYLTMYAVGVIPLHMHFFFAVLAVLGGCYFTAIAVVRRHPTSGTPSSFMDSIRIHRRLLLIIGLFAVLFRMALLWAYPGTTDDFFRYIWDGYLLQQGVNPYAFAPGSDHSIPLRDDYIYPLINHKHVVTIYPPLLQLGFLLSYQISPGLYGFKLLPVLFDLGCMILLVWLLHHYRRPMGNLVIYAWNPLIVLEFAGNAHIDIIGVFFLLLFVGLMIQHKPMWAAIALAASTLTKWVPILLLPFVWRKRRIRDSAVFTGLFVAALILSYIPFLDAGPHLFLALKTFASKWHFNASVFDGLFYAIRGLIPDFLVVQYAQFRHLSTEAAFWAGYRTDLALAAAKGVTVLVFLAFYALLWYRADRFRAHRDDRWPYFWFLLFSAILLLSPTVHPWYLAWLIPFLAFYPVRAFIYLSIAVLMSYHVLQDYVMNGIWQEHPLIKLLIYVPFFALLFWEWKKRKQAAGRF